MAFNSDTSLLVTSNEAPVISSINFNDSTAITLVEDATKTIYATTTITDNNYCSTISSVIADFYRSGVGSTTCDNNTEDNYNNCYARETCTVVDGTCTGGVDTTADYLCSAAFQYFAEPTDSGNFSAQNWLVMITASDGTSTSATSSSGIELNSLSALDVTSSLDYGSLASNSNTGSNNSNTTVSNTGNVEIDLELSGTNMTSGGDFIFVGNQEYSNSAFTYGTGTDLATTTASVDLILPKATTTNGFSDDVKWGIAIDNNQPGGNYSGTNTFTAINPIIGFSLVQQNGYMPVYVAVGNATTSDISVTLNSSTTADNLLISSVAVDKSSGTFTVPSGFTLIHSSTSPNLSAALAYKITSGNEKTFTWDYTSNNSATMWVAEYSGMLTSNVLDQSLENEQQIYVASTSISTGFTSATSQANELAVAIVVSDSLQDTNGVSTWTNGFTEIFDNLGVLTEYTYRGTPNLRVATKELSSTSAVQTTFSTTDLGDNMYTIIATFKKE